MFRTITAVSFCAHTSLFLNFYSPPPSLVRIPCVHPHLLSCGFSFTLVRDEHRAAVTTAHLPRTILSVLTDTAQAVTGSAPQPSSTNFICALNMSINVTSGTLKDKTECCGLVTSDSVPLCCSLWADLVSILLAAQISLFSLHSIDHGTLQFPSPRR